MAAKQASGHDFDECRQALGIPAAPLSLGIRLACNEGSIGFAAAALGTL